MSHEEMPALVIMYKNAMRQVYGANVFVNKHHYSRFSVFEDDLRELHIPIKDYAYTVATILRSWCKQHNFKIVPVNTFTGDWALAKFMKVWKSETVTINKPTSDDELLYSELLVARMYIATLKIRYVRLSSIVEDIKVMLSNGWYSMYVNRDRQRNKFIDMAIPILCEEFGVLPEGIETYSDIASRLS